MTVFDKFSEGVDTKFGENTPYSFGDDYNEYSDVESSLEYYSDFAKGAVNFLQNNNVNILNIRSFYVYGLGKLTTIKATVSEKKEIKEIANILKDYCELNDLKNIRSWGSIGILEYASYVNLDKRIPDIDKYCDINYQEYEDGDKEGYVLLIHADSLN